MDLCKNIWGAAASSLKLALGTPTPAEEASRRRRRSAPLIVYEFDLDGRTLCTC